MAKKTPFAVVINPDSAERIRDAAYWSGETVGGLVEKGTLMFIERLEADRGGPFAPRSSNVRTGRPRKARDIIEMPDKNIEPKLTISFGGAWKMTLLRVSSYDIVRPEGNETRIQAWCGFARTELRSVTVYDQPDENTVLAEVIFEPDFIRNASTNGKLQLQNPGRTFYAGCPGSGRGKENEQALLDLLPEDDLLRNILLLSMLTLGQP